MHWFSMSLSGPKRRRSSPLFEVEHPTYHLSRLESAACLEVGFGAENSQHCEFSIPVFTRIHMTLEVNSATLIRACANPYGAVIAVFEP